MGSIEAERNRNRRRDKQFNKKRAGMRVDDSARKLALVKRRKTDAKDYIKPDPEKLIEFFAANDPDYLFDKMREVFNPDLL